MRHDITVLMAGTPEGSPVPQNHFWKTIGFNDYYLTGYNDYKYPLGSVQVIGNYHEWMYNLVPEALGDLLHRKVLAARMLPIFLLTEDLPRLENRVELTSDGNIRVTYQANNLKSHGKLVEVMTRHLRDAGYGPIAQTALLRVEQGGGYHHCGTAKMGNNPATSVLDRHCKAHDLDNLFVVDASCFPAASACNPALTIAANALRVAAYLKTKL